MTDLGYYMIHSCGDSAEHQEFCDAVFVWCSGPVAAKVMDPEKRDAEIVEVQRAAEADKYHSILGDRFGNGWGKSGPDEDRAMRALHFTECQGTSCDTCGLWEFDSLPESKVCEDCLQCGECGHCGCCEDESRCCAVDGCEHEGHNDTGCSGSASRCWMNSGTTR